MLSLIIYNLSSQVGSQKVTRFTQTHPIHLFSYQSDFEGHAHIVLVIIS